MMEEEKASESTTMRHKDLSVPNCLKGDEEDGV